MLHYPTIRHMRAFEAVARLGSFGNAADELCISPSALSQNITQIEDILEVRLIDRTTRQMELTPIGQQLYPRIVRWLEEMEETFQETIENGRLNKGHVRVGCLASIAINVLPEIIDRFQKIYPNIRVSVQDDTGVGVEDSLITGSVDIGLLGSPSRDNELEFLPLFDEPYQLLCPADHPLAKQNQKVSWNQLKSYNYISLSSRTNIGKQLKSETDLAEKIPTPTYEVAQLATVWGLVDQGHGVSALPRSACPRKGETQALELHRPHVFRTVGALTHSQRSLSPAAHEFLSVLKAAYGQDAEQK